MTAPPHSTANAFAENQTTAYSMLMLLAVAFMAALWVFGRSAFRGVTKWLLWALALLCACAGVIALLDAKGRPLAFLGGLALPAFAAYLIKVTESLQKKS